VLADAGITLDYAVFESDELHRIIYQPAPLSRKAYEMGRSYLEFVPKVRAARDYDAVLVNREATLIGPAILERWVVRMGTPIIYHLDDPLYIPYRSESNGALASLKFFGKVKSLCAMAKVVTANSASHVAFAQQVNRNVWEIPSVVDADRYDGWRAKPTDAQRTCVGWSGSPSTVGNLQVIREPLRELGQRKDVELRLIGAPDFNLPDVQHTPVRWDPETEVADIRKLDIGLVPLPLTAWTPHKFYLKLVQYMALGIPAVATPLGSNPIVIEEGRTGFLANGQEQWLRLVKLLIDDRELREAMGRRAADIARQRYTVQANAERIVAAFRSAVE
jgi:glycosyltransferase involved in cell wall biosynthesis